MVAQVGRLNASLIVAMLGFVTDWAMTVWILKSFSGFMESNQSFLPEIGIPLLVMTYVAADFILPSKRLYDNVIFTLPVLQWTGPVQNTLVLLKLVKGLSFFYVAPFVLLATFMMLHFVKPRLDTYGSINRES